MKSTYFLWVFFSEFFEMGLFIIYFQIFIFFWQGSGGITIKKTGQALVFGIYEEPVTPGQCNMVVERLGDYLIDQGL